MSFISPEPEIRAKNPIFSIILGNTIISTIKGVSGAGPSPEKSVLVPNLDAELVAYGRIESHPVSPNTATGCPTPSTITRSMMELTGIKPLFINSGLLNPPSVPCLDMYGEPGRDPRTGDAVPAAKVLFRKGRWLGSCLSSYSDLLFIGECVPGGTTTALCTLRALGYDAKVSSSYIDNPVSLKEKICAAAFRRLEEKTEKGPMDLIECLGDPMMAVAIGMVAGFSGKTILAGGTQMLAVAALLKELDLDVPEICTTVYVRDDRSASFVNTLADIGSRAYYVDPDFGSGHHEGLKRYCIGEVKEGMGAGGAMMLASLMGHNEKEIKSSIYGFIGSYH